MAEYEDGFETTGDSGGTLSKGLAGLAGTFAAWGIYQGVATMVMRRSASGFVNLLKNSKKVKGGLSRLRAEALDSDNLDLWDLLKRPSVGAGSDITGTMGRMVRSWDEKAAKGDQFARMLKAGGRARKTALGYVGKADTKQRQRLAKSVGFDYLKTLSYEAPLFYAGERAWGVLSQEPHQSKDNSRAWYNLPGHALDFAKWLPTYAAFDMVGRGILGGVPAAKTALTQSLISRSKESSVVSDALHSVSGLIPKADRSYRHVKHAYQQAYRASGGESGKGLFTIKDSSKVSRYTINKHPLQAVMKRSMLFVDHYKLLRSKNLPKAATKTIHRSHIINPRGDITDTSISTIINTTDPASGRVGHELTKALYRVTVKPKRTSLTAAMLGMRRATLRDVKASDASLYKSVFKDLIEIDKKYELRHGGPATDRMNQARRFIWGIGPTKRIKGRFDPHRNTSHLDLLMQEGMYYDPRRNRLMDMTNVTPGALIRRAARYTGNALSFGGRFDMTSLYQMNLLRTTSPDIVVSKSNQVLNPRAMRREYKNLGGKLLRFGDKSGMGDTELYGAAVYVNTPGRKGMAMYGMRPRAVDKYLQYEQMTKSELSLLPATHHGKLIKVLGQKYNLLNAETRDPDIIRDLPDTKIGRLRRKLYDKYNLFGGDALNGSVMDLFRQTFGPTALNRLFNKERNPILRKYGFDLKAYKAAGQGGKEDLTSMLGIMSAALSNVNRRADVIHRAPVFDEFLKPFGADDIDADLLNRIRRKRARMVIGDPETALSAAGDVLRHGVGDTLENTPGYHEVKRLYQHINDTGDMGELYNAAGEKVAHKFQRFIANYRVSSLIEQGRTADLLPGQAADAAGNLAQRVTHVLGNVISSTTNQRDRALADMVLVGANFRSLTKGKRISSIADGEENLETFGKLLGLLKHADDTGTLDNFSKEIGTFVKYKAPNEYAEQMFKSADSLASQDPYIAVHKDISSVASLSGYYLYDTFGQALDFMGLGWNRAKYHNILPKRDGSGGWQKSAMGLFASRATLFGGISASYGAVDAFLDVNPMFDGTMFDEGLTVAAADKAANARLLAARIYDIAGVTDAAQYMEGLMPKSTSILPGAITGFMMGGIPGAIAGGVLNRYVHAQTEGGPLSAAALLPPLAPFTADLTKSYDELKSIYSGETHVPYRKGKGWTLGTTPIEGGRVQAYTPNWYARLKSQYKATPALYGSKIEEFIFKDLPVVDFSLGDLIAPNYLENKHFKDRPYVVGDAPFSEVPIVGPLLGATIGRAYKALHPFGSNALMHQEDAIQAFGGGVADSQSTLSGYGGIYAGAPALGLEAEAFGTPIPGRPGEYSHGEVTSPFAMRQMTGEMVYTGFIEPAGLLGFTTSAMLWGGDEPFTDQPVFAAAGEMDSFRRDYWDQNLGDLFMLNEGFRRLFPRPRSSQEKVNPLSNTMPGWMPDDYKHGDPYCLTAESLVEVDGALKEAETVRAGDMIRTVKGRYYPVKRVVPRPVDEEIYVIKIKGLPWEIRVTDEHPFLVNYEWVEASYLKETDRVIYPLLSRELTTVFPWIERDSTNKLPKEITVNGLFARLSGLLFETLNTINSQYFTLHDTDKGREARHIIAQLFGFDKPANSNIKVKPLLNYINRIFSEGLPHSFYGLKLIEFLQFMSVFASVDDQRRLCFKLPNETIAYQAWSIMAQRGFAGELESEDMLVFSHIFGRILSQLMGIETHGIHGTPFSEWAHYETRHYNDQPTQTYLHIAIEYIRKEHYKGFVYGFEVDTDDSFCVPGAVTHNTKIPYGELLLPGAGYEAANDVTVNFPTGPSSLGKDAYTQALQMIGVGDPMTERVEEILEEGTRSHRIVQESLTRFNSRVRSEAMVYDPYENIKGYVDLLLPNQQAQSGYIPGEIKTISGRGFDKLRRPKSEHLVQLNTYMNIMKENQGKIIYVDRDDPSRARTFNVKYDAELHSATINRLHQARELAQQYLSEGFGEEAHGYSYVDRAKVLMNANVFGKEFKDTWKIVKDQAAKGLLSDDQLNQFTNLQRQHKTMMWKHEMVPHRFKSSKIFSPNAEYEHYSLNENIKAAAEYDLPSRVVGSVWEKFTSMKSPLHSKFFGVYSPEEQYERNVLYGKDFKNWTNPVDDWIKPYGVGLRSVTDPIQGALSFGTGGMIMGGPVLASITMPLGMLYGAMHGAYRAATGSRYIPEDFAEKAQINEYFDRAKFYQAQQMYRASGSFEYQKEMTRTSIGWNLSGIADEGLRMRMRPVMNPEFQQLGSDRGFGSPWKGIKKPLEKLIKSTQGKGRDANSMVLEFVERHAGKVDTVVKGLDKRINKISKQIERGVVKDNQIDNKLEYITHLGQLKTMIKQRIGTAPAPEHVSVSARKVKNDTAHLKHAAAERKAVNSTSDTITDKARKNAGNDNPKIKKDIPKANVESEEAALKLAKSDERKTNVVQNNWLVYAAAGAPLAIGSAFSADTGLRSPSRRSQSPAAQGFGSDRGFGSPWQGMDHDRAMMPLETFRIGAPDSDPYAAKVAGAISGLPSWDKPYFFPLLSTAPERRDDILKMVDPQMAGVLNTAWGRRNDITNESAENYFGDHYKPSMYDAMMHPAVNIDDVKMRTIQDMGYDAHDFGLGWRDQEARLRNTPFSLKAVDINGEGDQSQLIDMDPVAIRDMLQQALHTFGLGEARIILRSLVASEGPVRLNLVISRDRSNIDFINGLPLDG